MKKDFGFADDSIVDMRDGFAKALYKEKGA